MNQMYRQMIAKEFRDCVNNTILRLQKEETNRPFHSALLSKEALFWSRFERSFSTSFGQRVIEEIARLVALSNGASAAQRQKETFIDLDNSYISAVSTHVQGLRNGRHSDWNSTVNAIKALPLSGTTTQLRIISDLWWKKDGINNYISLKTVKPNIDQTVVAKEDCLYLTLADQNCNAYFGLPYNPYGEDRSDYAHTHPMGVFDFHHDPVVLIGKEMWDTIGGVGCYEEVLDIAHAVGVETKQAISEMFN